MLRTCLSVPNPDSSIPGAANNPGIERGGMEADRETKFHRTQHISPYVLVAHGSILDETQFIDTFGLHIAGGMKIYAAHSPSVTLEHCLHLGLSTTFNHKVRS